MRNRKIYLLRHAKPEFWNEKIYIGQSDIDIVDIGIDNCKDVANKFDNLKIEKIYCSSLRRTIRTARIINDVCKTKIEIVPELNEIHLGEWELKSRKEIMEKYPEEYKKRGEDIENYHTPGGESFFEFEKRINKAFQFIINDSTEDILIVSHAGVNRVLLTNILNMPMKNMFSIKQDYCCINIICQENDRLYVEYINNEKTQ